MNLRIVLVAVFALCLAAVPAAAQTLYSNGPVNGTTDGWTINFGFVVSDTFSLSSASTLTGVNFYSWVFPGDIVNSVELAITSSEFGGTTYYDQVVNFTASNCSANQLGYNVCLESSVGMTPVNLASGTYWLNLENACCTDDPLYWDENSGPSQASENSVGTIPSEAFTVFGTAGTSTTSTTSTTPEPSSVMLWGSGIVGLAGAIRRKLF
jgi:hypothetical protein